jgi:hypothetical protein
MPGSLRLLLQPIGTPGRELELVQGCSLGLAAHGSKTSNASVSPVPAKIEFVGRFTPEVRTHPAPDERPLGELSGTIELRGPLRQGFFTCDDASLEQLRNPPPDPPADPDQDLVAFEPRDLELEFLDTFSGAQGQTSKPRLRLPPDAGDFRYLEVVAKLTIGGATEADFDQNDTLDVTIKPLPPFEYPFSM